MSAALYAAMLPDTPSRMVLSVNGRGGEELIGR
jgi:hypothetical protein